MIPVVVSAIALAVVETVARRGAADPVRWRAPGTALSLASALALLATTIAAAANAAAAGLTEWVGLLPITVGIALRFAAIRALGASFTSETVLVPGRPVVTTGLYRWTRHPSDLGLVLYAGGVTTLGASKGALGFSIVVLATVAWRIAGEESIRSRSGGG